MEKLSITTKDQNFSITLIRIIQGELKNWGYEVSEPRRECDSWGEDILVIDVKQNGGT